MSRFTAPLLLALFATACADGTLDNVNIFTIQDDEKLGHDLAKEIAANPDEYGPLLDPDEYPEAYDHLNAVRDEILASGQVDYADEFKWETHIIDDDETLNAFCAPGGYIYVYTGLIRYLEVEDHFAGVMGHEMAHAANRHSTEQMTKAYGIQELLSFVLGSNPGLAGDLAAGLVGLEFSREDEAQADEYSVRYLCETDYAADGAAGFFEKLLAEGDDTQVPEFLSTHPSSPSRVEDIQAEAADLGCSTKLDKHADWQGFLDSLPPEKGGGN